LSWESSTMAKIHRQIIATGREWKPCVGCGTKLQSGEILTAIDGESNAPIRHWFCEACTELYYGYLSERSWRQTWKLRRRGGDTEAVNINGADYKPAG